MAESTRAEQLLNYYHGRRVDGQRKFYDDRADKYQKRDRTLRVVAGLLMLATGPMAVIHTTLQGVALPWMRVLLGLLPTVFPAAATALLTMRGILQYENTQYLYHQTYFKLGMMALDERPEPGDEEFDAKVKLYIEKVERAIANETAQWLAGESDVRPAEPPQ